MSCEVLLILYFCTTLRICSTGTVVVSNTLGTSSLEQHLSMWRGRFNDEVLENMRCECVQTYIVIELGYFFPEADRNILMEPAKRSGETICLFLIHWITLLQHYIRPYSENEVSAVEDSACSTSNEKEITHTNDHTRERLYSSVYCKSEGRANKNSLYKLVKIIYITVRSPTKWESTGGKKFRLFFGKECSLGYCLQTTSIW